MPITYLDDQPRAPTITYLDGPPVNIFREDTQKVVSAPAGLQPKSVVYLDDTQNNGKSKGNFFGYMDVGDPMDVAKGFMRSRISNVVNLATLDKPIIEKRLEVIDTASREFSAWDLLTQFKPLSAEGRMAQIRVSEKFGGSLTFEKEKKSLQDRLSTMGEIRKKAAPVMQGMGLGVGADGDTETVFSMLGAGAENISMLWGLQRITGSAKLFSAMMGAGTKSSAYEQARNAGLGIDEADQSANLRAALQIATEYAGSETLFKAIGGSSLLGRVLKGWLTEGTEEAANQVGDILITNGYDITNIGIKEAVFQTLLAGGIGAISTTPLSVMMKSDPPTLEQTAKRLKMKPEDVLKMVEATEKSVQEGGALQDGINAAISQAVEDEVGGIRTSDRADEEAASVKIMQDIADGKDIDISGLPQDVQDQIAAMNIPKVEKVGPAIKIDNPGGEWLANKQRAAEEDIVKYEGKSSIGKGLNGSVTGYYKEPIILPISELSKIPGAKNEEQFRDTLEKTPELKRSMEENGYDQSNPILIGVNHKGQPFIIEGNHRVAAAQQAGIDRIPVEVKYFNGGEAAAGNFTPEIVSNLSGDQKKPSPLPSREIALEGGNTGKPPSDGGGGTPPPEGPERDYEAVATKKPKRTFFSDTRNVIASAGDLASEAFVPVSTRLGKIDQGLKHAVRKFVFNVGLHGQTDNKNVKPFIEKVSNEFSVEDYRILDLALKNSDVEKISELTQKYRVEKEYQAARTTLDNLHDEAEKSGIEIGFIENYFPRKVKKDRVAEYLAFLQGQKEWSLIKIALQEEDPDGTYTPEERVEFVNKWLRGYKNNKLKQARPSFAQTRSVSYITPEMNDFYEDSMPVLINYIASMRHGIESRKLFGSTSEETDENIGAYVLGLVEQGVINPKQENAVRRILKAVVEPTGTRGVVSWAKNATYVYTMGSPISALTQLQDLAFSLYKNGYYRTGKSVLKTLVGKQALSKEDLGITNILQEFEDSDRAGKAVRGIFRASGLTFMDDIGKSVYIDAAWGRLRNAAAKNKTSFQEEMGRIFGESAEQVISDLAAGNITEDTKYLLFSELSDVQPISLAEQPELYLRSGNGRIFYMLKTYTVRTLDLQRREIFDNLASRDLKKTATGLKNLVSMAAALMLMGMATDELKDLILGREIDLNELVMDNILKTMGASKYQIYKTKRDGIAATFWQTLFAPPVFAPLDDVISDISDYKNEEKEVKDFLLWSRVPIGGKFYYWWWGGGAAEKEARNPTR